MKGLAILGSTGSIGVQSLDVARLHPDRFSVETLVASKDLDTIESQIREFNPKLVSVGTRELADHLRSRVKDHHSQTKILFGEDGINEATIYESVDLVVVGLPGSVGLKPSFVAVEAGKDVALATKETLVMAGAFFMDLIADNVVELLPVDSEQSAIFQCLQGNKDKPIKRILLTASGGPFRQVSSEKMAQATKGEVLDHPRWKMGPKVTVDSATLMNKGLEVIEARWLFDVDPSKIEVVIHPQSVIHSMVEFQDTSIIAQLSDPDMRAPISYAMAYPDRIESGAKDISFPEIAALTFESPDMKKFPLLKAAYDSLEADEQVAPIILNAADEVAVGMFLDGMIPFSQIAPMVLKAMDTIPSVRPAGLEDVIALHKEQCAKMKSDYGK